MHFLLPPQRLSGRLFGALLGIWLAVSLPGCRGETAPHTPDGSSAATDAPAAATLRVLTYNIRYSKPNFDGVMSAILDADADIVCLQEVGDDWRAELTERLADRYPHMLFGRGFFDAGGKAVLACVPIARQAQARPRGSLFPVLLVRAETALGPVELLNVHLRPPQWAGTANAHRKEMASAFALRGGDVPLIVLGDFNEGDAGGAVTYLIEQGFRSALNQFEPDEPTWRWSGRLLTASARFDHVLYQGLECVSAKVLESDASDHRPVLAVFSKP